MTLKDIIHTHMSDRADFLRARPEYRKETPGTMSNTMHAATMMKAWSPDWYHWFKFSVATENNTVRSRCSAKRNWRVNYIPESPPVSGFVPLNTVGAPTQEYDMMVPSGRYQRRIAKLCGQEGTVNKQ